MYLGLQSIFFQKEKRSLLYTSEQGKHQTQSQGHTEGEHRSLRSKKGRERWTGLSGNMRREGFPCLHMSLRGLLLRIWKIQPNIEIKECNLHIKPVSLRFSSLNAVCLLHFLIAYFCVPLKEEENSSRQEKVRLWVGLYDLNALLFTV